MKKTTAIIVCADDFGFSPGVNAGIIEAAQKGRISALSCMTAGPAWQAGAEALKALPVRPALGLHICLTRLAPLAPRPSLAPAGRLPSFGSLLLKAHCRCLPMADIEAEIRAQTRRFMDETGAAPEFIDGHMHVHQFPQIRDTVISIAREFGAWTRSTRENPLTILGRGTHRTKALALSIAGRSFEKRAEKAGLKTNCGLSGLYSFSPRADYGALAAKFLSAMENGGLFVCHPGRADEALAKLDPNTRSREKELAFLLSAEFEDLLGRLGLRPVPSPPGRQDA